MREILFKAKRIDNGEWVEGFLLIKYYQELPHDRFAIRYKAKDDEYEWTPKYLTTEIDPETVCQYTGLTDKNGNKIWENDICDRKEKYPEVVKQYQGDWVLDYSYLFRKDVGYSYCNLGFYVCERKCIEVIGNIFDNPELLAGGVE